MLSSIYNGIYKFFQGKIHVKVLLVGLESSGKSTLLYQFRLGSFVETEPTYIFKIEACEYKNLVLTFWDYGFSKKEITYSNMRTYLHGTNLVIFVVDSADRKRIDEARDELHYIYSQLELKNTKLLVFANKQDIHGAMTSNEITNLLNLESIENKGWYVQGCSSINGQGLDQGFDWVSNNPPDSTI